MLSETHSVPRIVFFLQEWMRNIKKTILPRCVVTDFSFALIHGVVQTFNLTSLSDYLEKCFEYLSLNKNKPSVPLFICCSHMMQTFAKSKQLSGLGKVEKKFILHCLATIIDENDFSPLVGNNRISC